MLLNWNRFQDTEEIKQKVMMQLFTVPKSHCQNASDNGRIAGTSVWCLKGTTLKGIMTATPWVSLFFLALCQILFDQAMYMTFISTETIKLLHRRLTTADMQFVLKKLKSPEGFTKNMQSIGSH
jgi:hypothetical protein